MPDDIFNKLCEFANIISCLKTIRPFVNLKPDVLLEDGGFKTANQTVWTQRMICLSTNRQDVYLQQPDVSVLETKYHAAPLN